MFVKNRNFGQKSKFWSTKNSRCKIILRIKKLTQYLGLSRGNKGAELWITLQNSSLVSPPLNPPIANPGAFLLVISLLHLILGSGSSPPWIIGKIFWQFPSSEFRHRSSHRTERSAASSILAPRPIPAETTSSSCITMSELGLSKWRRFFSGSKLCTKFDPLNDFFKRQHSCISLNARI